MVAAILGKLPAANKEKIQESTISRWTFFPSENHTKKNIEIIQPTLNTYLQPLPFQNATPLKHLAVEAVARLSADHQELFLQLVLTEGYMEEAKLFIPQIFSQIELLVFSIFLERKASWSGSGPAKKTFLQSKPSETRVFHEPNRAVVFIPQKGTQLSEDPLPPSPPIQPILGFHNLYCHLVPDVWHLHLPCFAWDEASKRRFLRVETQIPIVDPRPRSFVLAVGPKRRSFETQR